VRGDAIEKSLRILKPGSTVVSLVGPPDAAFARTRGMNFFMVFVFALLSRKLIRRARKGGVGYSFLFVRPDGGRLAEIGELLKAGRIRPVIHSSRRRRRSRISNRGGLRGKSSSRSGNGVALPQAEGVPTMQEHREGAAAWRERGGSHAGAAGAPPLLRSWETAVINWAGAKGLLRRMLFGTPCAGH
jgi:hypothetical protein